VYLPTVFHTPINCLAFYHYPTLLIKKWMMLPLI